MSMARWVPAASISEVAEGEVKGVVVEGHEIAIYRLDGDFYATANLCTHGQAYLSDGWVVDDCQIECPLHAGCFDIRSGKAMGPPVDEDLAIYPVRMNGDVLEVEVPR